MGDAVSEAVIVMGVSAVGKTVVAKALAARLGWAFLEGDSLHPPQNVAKMRAGTPLTDADRWPWLDAIAEWIGARLAEGSSAVVACSALKRSYRDRLTQGRADIRIVYLHGAHELLARRIAARKGHFMPPGLLDSQIGTLEPPGPDEGAISVDVAPPPEEITAEILRQLQAGSASSTSSPPFAAQRLSSANES